MNKFLSINWLELCKQAERVEKIVKYSNKSGYALVRILNCEKGSLNFLFSECVNEIFMILRKCLELVL